MAATPGTGTNWLERREREDRAFAELTRTCAEASAALQLLLAHFNLTPAAPAAPLADASQVPAASADRGVLAGVDVAGPCRTPLLGVLPAAPPVLVPDLASMPQVPDAPLTRLVVTGHTAEEETGQTMDWFDGGILGAAPMPGAAEVVGWARTQDPAAHAIAVSSHVVATAASWCDARRVDADVVGFAEGRAEVKKPPPSDGVWLGGDAVYVGDLGGGGGGRPPTRGGPSVRDAGGAAAAPGTSDSLRIVAAAVSWNDAYRADADAVVPAEEEGKAETPPPSDGDGPGAAWHTRGGTPRDPAALYAHSPAPPVRRTYPDAGAAGFSLPSWRTGGTPFASTCALVTVALGGDAEPMTPATAVVATATCTPTAEARPPVCPPSCGHNGGRSDEGGAAGDLAMNAVLAVGMMDAGPLSDDHAPGTVVSTDQQGPFLLALLAPPTSPRTHRWRLALSHYAIRIAHLIGPSYGTADALSRSVGPATPLAACADALVPVVSTRRAAPDTARKGKGGVGPVTDDDDGVRAVDTPPPPPAPTAYGGAGRDDNDDDDDVTPMPVIPPPYGRFTDARGARPRRRTARARQHAPANVGRPRSDIPRGGH